MRDVATVRALVRAMGGRVQSRGRAHAATEDNQEHHGENAAKLLGVALLADVVALLAAALPLGMIRHHAQPLAAGMLVTVG